MKKIYFLLTCVTCVFFLASSHVFSASRANSATITLGGGYEFFSSKRQVRNTGIPIGLIGYNFGHRVYKNYDPRAKVMRETCHEVLEAVGVHNDPIFKLAMELERIALQDDYFAAKKLYPNVDFYSGITLSAIGIPTNMFTVIFALARTVGWVAQWNEMISNPYRLARPRQLYTGPKKRDYANMDKR